jgi:hypothetical protein
LRRRERRRGAGRSRLTEFEALILSAVAEAAIAYALAWATRWECRGAAHVAAGSAAATAITHPQLWTAALWAYERYPYWPSVLTLEAVVVVVEGVAIAWMAMLRLDRAMLVSLVANSGSLALGLLIGG